MGNTRGIIPVMVAVVLSGMLTACSRQSSAPASVSKDIHASAPSGDAHVSTNEQ